jgi:asparagine synthase (glutamine-hydrolysing)
MCGIAGIYAPNVAPGERAAIVGMVCDAMIKRGPDASGFWQDQASGVSFGHRRLSIIDPQSRSNQPMVSPDGKYALVFNGEIYNYRSIRQELEAEGQTFRTAGDTEVVLWLLARHGIGAVERLRGMFALGFWDGERQTLYLARDPYGIKPLYFGRTKDGLLFASQVRAIMAGGIVSRTIEPAGVAGFMLWGSVPEPWTIYRDVEVVPAGSWIAVRNAKVETVTTYRDVSDYWRHESADSAEPLDSYIRRNVLDSVRHHLVADVPVGVFLSGGVDSGAVVAVMSQLSSSVEGVTVRFEEFQHNPSDEAPRAQQIAAAYGINHHIRTVERREFEADLPRLLQAMDQPSIDGVNTWFASKAVAERGYKVVLSGIGGDELLCGYPSFRTIPKIALINRLIQCSGPAKEFAKAILGVTGRKFKMPKLEGLGEFPATPEAAYFLQRALFLPDELPALIGADLAEEGLARLASGISAKTAKASPQEGWAGRIAALESTRYLRNQLLRDSDWASMAHSLELRTPLVDHVLASQVAPYTARLRRGAGKKYLASVPSRALPSSIVRARKTGFGLPIGRWIEQVDDAQAWRNVSALRSPGVPWARRWAYVVGQSFVPGLAAR